MPETSLSVLCIGGLDPSGGAGLLADARACAAFGAHGLGVATASAPEAQKSFMGSRFSTPIRCKRPQIRLLGVR